VTAATLGVGCVDDDVTTHGISLAFTAMQSMPIMDVAGISCGLT
jgi:hypothetical protein